MSGRKRSAEHAAAAHSCLWSSPLPIGDCDADSLGRGVRRVSIAPKRSRSAALRGGAPGRPVSVVQGELLDVANDLGRPVLGVLDALVSQTAQLLESPRSRQRDARGRPRLGIGANSEHYPVGRVSVLDRPPIECDARLVPHDPGVVALHCRERLTWTCLRLDAPATSHAHAAAEDVAEVALRGSASQWSHVPGPLPSGLVNAVANGDRSQLHDYPHASIEERRGPVWLMDRLHNWVSAFVRHEHEHSGSANQAGGTGWSSGEGPVTGQGGALTGQPVCARQVVWARTSAVPKCLGAAPRQRFAEI